LKGKVRLGASAAILISDYFYYKSHPPIKSLNDFTARASVNADMFANQPRRMLGLFGSPATHVS
jgi:hypothetical protein